MSKLYLEGVMIQEQVDVRLGTNDAFFLGILKLFQNARRIRRSREFVWGGLPLSSV
ncbi:hypothetical protein [Allorhodopirellula solitaria]|uniref:hypothetical protein n=1 Tax=Allorhodopirellula solitaria TaxID=2527987 RepID=UPI0016471B04|nr:hypothetical protein [Allorhodopirellula solitaria]